MKFACTGDIGNGSVTLRAHQNIEKEELSTKIDLTEPVSLTFSLKYLVNFCKASSLSQTVTLSLSNEVPLLVEYKMSSGYVRFYLAPKVCGHPIYLFLEYCAGRAADIITLICRLTKNNFGASGFVALGSLGWKIKLGYYLTTLYLIFVFVNAMNVGQCTALLCSVARMLILHLCVAVSRSGGSAGHV